MVVELQIVSDIMNNRNKVVAKGALVKKLFDLEEIEVEEFINPKTGKAVKKYSGVYSNNIYYKINTPYESLKELRINKSYPIKGFMGYSRHR